MRRSAHTCDVERELRRRGYRRRRVTGSHHHYFTDDGRRVTIAFASGRHVFNWRELAQIERDLERADRERRSA